mmetsp:Transcript_116623/g.249359  ORF Transcript_116623/g.249359 Transcript_116623/m.249359 type:complete len:260 (-) Transcript_116623:48-827(-)
MPPIPALSLSGKLNLPATPRGTPLASYRGKDKGGALPMSARHILKPTVGMGSMISALGDIRPPWDQAAVKSPRSARKTHQDEELFGGDKLYSVGRARARGQMRTAVETLDQASQLRRLEQALENPVPRYDQDFRLTFEWAESQVGNLSRRLQAAEKARLEGPVVFDVRIPEVKAKKEAAEEEAAAEEAAAEEDLGEEGEGAATKIQSLYRGKKERAEVERLKKEKEEETAAAVKIQAIHRGKQARKDVDAIKAGGEADP